jgi:flagellar basal body P-ring formation protein FlgA
MIRLLIALFVALVATNAQATGQPTPERPILKSEVIVTGDIVRIGDLIEHAGIVATVPIFRAPDLGHTGTVSADAVLEAVRNHALIGVESGGVRDIVVTRASRTIPAKDIEDAITQALSARFDLGPSKDIQVNFARDMRTMYVEPSAKGAPRVTHIDFDTYSGRFEAILEIPTSAGKRSVVQLAGRAIATVEVATVARTLERGAIVKDADVLMERRPRAETGRGMVTNREQVVGFAARGPLQPGRPLRFADLMKPDLVQRNETVTLVYEVPGIVLTIRGKATEGGGEGDVISVLNEQSKRTVQGTIIGPGRVLMSNGSPRRVANNINKPSATADVR